MTKRRNKLREDLSNFLRQYGRRGASPSDANDRHYSRRIEDQIKRMKSEDLDKLMRGEDEAGDADGDATV